MASLRFPPRFRGSLKTLQGLSADAVSELRAALSTAEVLFYRKDLARSLKLLSVSERDLESLVEMLASLEAARVNADVSIDTFTDDLRDALVADQLGTENADGSDTAKRFTELLNIPSLLVPAKARILLLQGQTLCRAKIVSDIRPIFDSSDDPAKPEAAVIVHTLFLSYHTDSGKHPPKEFAVTLDTNDVDLMIGILLRAKSKEQALESLLAAARTPYLKIE